MSRKVPPRPERPDPRFGAWGPWEWRNYLLDPNHPERRAKPHVQVPAGITRCCLNAQYSVMFFEVQTEWGLVDHLMIRRHDGTNAITWWHKQRIKDELIGADRLAVEIFPPADEAIDDAHIWHLWVLPPGFRLPFTLER